jgi:hypothetical protein
MYLVCNNFKLGSFLSVFLNVGEEWSGCVTAGGCFAEVVRSSSCYRQGHALFTASEPFRLQ